MDSTALESFVNSEVDDNILPSLIEFTRIPNQTPTYDSEWATNGLLDKAADHVKTWVEAQGINGLTCELIKDEGAGPLLYIEIPATKQDAQTVLMYGHMDKQPPMDGWEEGLGPYEPVLRGDRLYGRGTSDDGYSIYAGMLIIKSLQKQNLDHERIVFIMESEEESGSPHLMPYIHKLAPRIGKVDLVLVIDTGGGNYEQLWTDASLRGVVNIMLDVSLLKSSMHSGEGSGVVPSSFRVQRMLLDRVEDSRTGRILLPELYLPLTPKMYSNAAKTVAALGEEEYKSAYSKHEEVEFSSPNTIELYLNNCYRPTLSITGASGLPDIPQAGNVLRTHTELKLAFRIPPGLDPEECERVIIKELTRDPPYNARVTVRRDHIGTGFLTPDFHPWLEAAVQDASQTFFGKDFLFSNAGGTIPLMAQLKKLYPDAQFLVTGVLGPNSNAHCPNESINLTFLKKFICCMAFVLNKQSTS